MTFAAHEAYAHRYIRQKHFENILENIPIIWYKTILCNVNILTSEVYWDIFKVLIPFFFIFKTLEVYLLPKIALFVFSKCSSPLFVAAGAGFTNNRINQNTVETREDKHETESYIN